LLIQLFKEIESPPEDLKKVFIDQDLLLRKHRLRFLTFDQQNLRGYIPFFFQKNFF